MDLLSNQRTCSQEKKPKCCMHACMQEGRLLLLEHGAASWGFVNAILARGFSQHVWNFGCFANRDISQLIREVRPTLRVYVHPTSPRCTYTPRVCVRPTCPGCTYTPHGPGVRTLHMALGCTYTYLAPLLLQGPAQRSSKTTAAAAAAAK